MSTVVARPVQKFHPTAGHLLGYLGLAVCAVVVGVVVSSEPHVVGLRVALGAVLAAVLIRIVLLRPRATAYAETLVLHGMVSDTALPLARVDAAVVRHMLVVWVGGDRYTCAGIARSTRSMVKGRSPGGSSVLGLHAGGPIGAVGSSAGVGSSGGVGSSADYATFVETRIEDLAKSARRDGRAVPEVRRRWAWVEISALVVSGLAFAGSLLVR